MSNHFINTIKLDLTANSKKEDFELQQGFSKLIRTRLSQKMEEIFDEFGSDQNIRIDKLELEIKGVEAENWEEDFTEKFIVQLRAKIKKLQSNSTSFPSSTIALDHADWVSFLFFLKNGILPWHSNQLTINDLEDLIRKEIESSFSLQQLEKQLKSGSNSLKRLIHQLSISTLELILEKISKVEITFLPFYKVLENTYSNWFDKNEIKLEIWNIAFQLLLHTKKGKENFKNKFQFQIITLSIAHFTNKKLEIKSGQKNENYLFNELKSNLLNSNIELNKSVKVLFQQKSYLKKSFPKKNTPIKTKKKHSNVVDKNDSIEKIMEQGTFINNAGLIILWPFLKLFFERIEMVEDNIFKSELKQNQAALILQYLATKKLLSFENELVLNKVLCNIPFEKPISTELSLEQDQIDLCESLLNAVIQNWGQLGNTSIQGLRETFINRPGKLSKKENGDWLLQVESKPFDVLLSSLPWTISIIKLPWMDQKIMVDWQ